jgi:hypothetical protein
MKGYIMSEKYSSKLDTHTHISNVAYFLGKIYSEITNRMKYHDISKLKTPELEIFDEYTSKLKETTYGSDEYKQCLKGMSVALDHHYSVNRHHPEHFKDGIKDMNLVDLIEMICDWKAATLRHADGDILKSIEINQKRFRYSDELKQIFINTLELFNE